MGAVDCRRNRRRSIIGFVVHYAKGAARRSRWMGGFREDAFKQIRVASYGVWYGRCDPRNTAQPLPKWAWQQEKQEMKKRNKGKEMAATYHTSMFLPDEHYASKPL